MRESNLISTGMLIHRARNFPFCLASTDELTMTPIRKTATPVVLLVVLMVNLLFGERFRRKRARARKISRVENAIVA